MTAVREAVEQVLPRRVRSSGDMIVERRFEAARRTLKGDHPARGEPLRVTKKGEVHVV